MKPNPADAQAGQSDSGGDRVLSLEEIAKHSKRVCQFVSLEIL